MILYIVPAFLSAFLFILLCIIDNTFLPSYVFHLGYKTNYHLFIGVAFAILSPLLNIVFTAVLLKCLFDFFKENGN